MRRSLFIKLFVSIFLATSLTLIGMALFFNQSFRAGFVDYINDNELARVEQLAVTTGQYHARYGGWTFLQQPNSWQLLLMQMGEETAQLSMIVSHQRFTSSHSAGREQAPLHRISFPLSRRIAVLDLQQRPLINSGLNHRIFTDMPFQQVAVNAEGEQVGWLRVYQDQNINQATSGELAYRFMQRQLSNFALVALFTAILSFFLALALVRHFLKPVHALKEGAARLHRGDYQHRIAVYSQDELGDLALDFNELANALQHQKVMRQQWVADISHELRTPITVLRCEIEAIQDGINPPSPEHIGHLHTGTCTLGNLVDDLHQLSLTDAGMLAKPDQVLDLIGVLDAAISQAQLRFRTRSISIVRQADVKGPLMILSEPDLLMRLFSNLLENCFRYTDPGGRVEVFTEHWPGEIIVIIQDSAPGVSDQDLPRLFERLYRVDKSRSRAFGGSGLGLSICQNLIAVHGGTISAEHSPLGGLRVIIRFPATNNGPTEQRVNKG